MKKIIATVLTTILALSALAGCTQVTPNTVFSADDLPGKVIGVQLGTTGDIYASDYEAEGSVIERYNKGADAVQALKQGKVDCVIIDNEPAKAFVAKNKDLMILPDPFELEDYAMCIAKTNSELKNKINAAIAQLKIDGTLAAIISNYIGDDTKGKSPYVSGNSDYSNGKLIMATNAHFEPYEYMEGGVVVGIDVDLAQAVADILKMELVIEDMDFDAIIAAVQSGKADIGVAGMTVTEDRLISVDFTDSYTTATQVIIVRKK
ncbi:MAG TPA: transporter substrate-binding domain-containing protein [Clostridia bacterium]|nr:transporter substrate-binding domain-containing protein [Clostridia bacterium]HPY99168.1 transporter substrate-binding domain-containing protein [Clostridia bacterium]HQC69215.1 transporter substrate-binding domain-containing protein [Clostridia bacterium]